MLCIRPLFVDGTSTICCNCLFALLVRLFCKSELLLCLRSEGSFAPPQGSLFCGHSTLTPFDSRKWIPNTLLHSGACLVAECLMVHSFGGFKGGEAVVRVVVAWFNTVLGDETAFQSSLFVFLFWLFTDEGPGVFFACTPWFSCTPWVSCTWRCGTVVRLKLAELEESVSTVAVIIR